MHRRRLLGVLAGASAALAGCLARQPAAGGDGEGANGDGFPTGNGSVEYGSPPEDTPTLGSGDVESAYWVTVYNRVGEAVDLQYRLRNVDGEDAIRRNYRMGVDEQVPTRVVVPGTYGLDLSVDGRSPLTHEFTVEEEYLEDCNEHATVAFVRSATDLEAEYTVGGMACANES